MVASTAALALTAVAVGFADASPAAPRTKVGSFSAPQVRSNSFRPHGPAQMAKTYSKFGAKPPDGLAKIMADLSLFTKRDSGSAAAKPEQYDIQYLTPVQVGTPPQTLNLDFDSGSADLWVFSTDMPEGESQGQAQYNPKKSSTSSQTNSTWRISYGDGSTAKGGVYTDTVSVGGVSVGAQAIEAAKQVSQQFTIDENNDGLLGLAFSSINTVSPRPVKTFFDNVAGKLDKAVWTADLRYHEAGSYDFGVIDDSKYSGEITYTDIDSSQGFWEFTSTGYSVGEGAEFQETPLKGIADTGTTLAMLPESVVEAYYKKIKGAKNDATQGGYVFPCDTTPPSFTFGVEDAKFTVPGEYINYAPIDEQSCFGGIQADTGIGFSIFGDIMLKAAFVVFEPSGSNSRIGFAAKNLQGGGNTASGSDGGSIEGSGVPESSGSGIPESSGSGIPESSGSGAEEGGESPSSDGDGGMIGSIWSWFF
ncbi:endothiapepsin [Xylariomycetidae sp. FL0641]|nr:endothiapepsin [Xylariomycetidae sp. FL0641]